MSMEWSTNPWDSSRSDVFQQFRLLNELCILRVLVGRLCEDVLVKSNGFLLKQISIY